MPKVALAGGFVDAPVEAARIFRAALDAMARPGTIHRVAGVEPPAPLSPAAGALALTLADHDTAVWLAPSLRSDEVARWLAFHTGAPLAEAREEAVFAFGPWAELAPLDGFAVGVPEYPDRSATLIVEIDGFGGDRPLELTGPGIETEMRLGLGPETPEIGAALAANARRFPLGLDFFFTCGDRLAAIPRSTRVGA